MERKQVNDILKAIQTEITAGCVLKLPYRLTPEEKAHNNACERANAIIQNYIEGVGLFQMTGRVYSANKESPTEEQPREERQKQK